MQTKNENLTVLSRNVEDQRTGRYLSVAEIIISTLDQLVPPERLSVSEAATKYRKLKNEGSYVGPWINGTTQYMVEPMDSLTIPELRAVIFVGPAQSGKTDALIINWLNHNVTCQPMDMTVYSPSMAASRDFSIRRVDRLHRDTEEVGDALRDEKSADNKFDKQYKHGMLFTLSWPSATELAGKPIPNVAFTDYDRMPENVDGEGSPFDLGYKRTTTFYSFGMTLAESSPSRPLSDPHYILTTDHEAPPTTGILSLYNRGDRRRWYWPCPHCWLYFEGEFEHLQWDATLPTKLDIAESVVMKCPHCGESITHDDKKEMNLWGSWLKDGQYFNDTGILMGQGERSSIASFWLKGVAAAFVTWATLVENFLTATEEYERTGSEDALQKFYNTDLALVYVPKALARVRIPEDIRAKAYDLGKKVVPAHVRFLVANVDVQKNAFVVQVHGISPGEPYDITIIDRFDILKSKRLDDDGERYYVKPSAYLEDWDLIEEEVMNKIYPLSGGSGTMAIRFTTCDSGGYAKEKGESVTMMAYRYYDKLRSEGKAAKFHLIKGDNKQSAPIWRISYPDASSKDKYSGMRGDIPVLMFNVHTLKDALSGRLENDDPGKGMLHFPTWLEPWFYKELCSETRTPKGWEKPSGARNEAIDLLVYCIGLCASSLLRLDKIKWDAPPQWAAPWAENDLVTLNNAQKTVVKSTSRRHNFAKLGEQLA